MERAPACVQFAETHNCFSTVRPAERREAASLSTVQGKDRSSMSASSSRPTAPVAPMMARRYPFSANLLSRTGFGSILSIPAGRERFKGLRSLFPRMEIESVKIVHPEGQSFDEIARMGDA